MFRSFWRAFRKLRNFAKFVATIRNECQNINGGGTRSKTIYGAKKCF